MNTLATVEHMSPPPAIPVAIIVRVSTSRQETARQVSDLQALAESKGWQVVEVCKETISGSAALEDRAGLMRALALAQAGRIKKVVVHEVSRVARRSSVAQSFVEALDACGVSLYWHAQSIETRLPNGKRNPAAGIMLALLAEMAQAEKDTLRERINNGIAYARSTAPRPGSLSGGQRGAATMPASSKPCAR